MIANERINVEFIEEQVFKCTAFISLGYQHLKDKINHTFSEVEKSEKFQMWKDCWLESNKSVYEDLQYGLYDIGQNLKKITNHQHFLKIGMVVIGSSLLLTPISPSNSEKVTSDKHYPEYRSIFKNKSQAFLNLLKKTEGVAHKFTLDNIGIAAAYGWNPTRNTQEFNKSVAEKIGLSRKETKIIAEISADTGSKKKPVQYVPKQLKKTVLTQEQMNKSAIFMMNFYEDEFIKVLKIKARQNQEDTEKAVSFYKSLPNNQQVVMIHMAYKVGTSGLLKYNQFFNNLFVYMNQPTEDNFTKIAPNFEYSYKTRDDRNIHDTKVENIHTVFFNDCAVDTQKYPVLNKQKTLESIKACQKLVQDASSKNKLNVGNS